MQICIIIISIIIHWQNGALFLKWKEEKKNNRKPLLFDIEFRFCFEKVLTYHSLFHYELSFYFISWFFFGIWCAAVCIWLLLMGFRRCFYFFFFIMKYSFSIEYRMFGICWIFKIFGENTHKTTGVATAYKFSLFFFWLSPLLQHCFP